MNILIADDDASCRQFLAALCKDSTSHQVVTVENGKEAWAVLDDPNRWFDVVFLDISMPHWTGFEVLKRLRASALHRSVEVVMCTASNDRTTINEAIALGAKHYIVKPCTARTVGAKLRQIEEQCVPSRPARAVCVSRRQPLRHSG
jgi:two-component system chemotaxis response regulator CheY